MAALADNKEVSEKQGILHSAPMAVDIIYRGALVMHNTSGYLAPAATGAGGIFAGVAMEKVDNSGGSAGDVECKYQSEGVFLLEGSGLAQGDVGDMVYASDDQTITKTSTNNPLVGQIIKFVSATQVWVKLERNPVAAS